MESSSRYTNGYASTSRYRNGTDMDHQTLDTDLGSKEPYTEYNTDKPFINDDYRPDPNKPVKAFPENNRAAVMSALKGLQDKIRQLEIERTSAEENLKSLAHETSKFRDILQSDPNASHISQVSQASQYSQVTQERGNLSQQNHDVHNRLETAEHRCALLERQLDNMRKMVYTAEQDKDRALKRMEAVGQQREETEEFDIRRRLDKIAELEREHLKLMATQTMAESKIRDLENRLKEERHHRQRMQDRAAELETVAETKRILSAATNGHSVKSSKKKKHTTSKHNAKKPTVSSARRMKRPTTYAPEKYKLNLAEIPFVAGKATTPSHSLPANFQEVLSLMKSHNPKLCKSPRQHSRNGFCYVKQSACNGTDSSSECSDMGELLLQLQDEFGHMGFEHQELSRQIADTGCDYRLREDLERELDCLVAKMEAKGEQIARLRQYQTKQHKKKDKKRPKSARSAASSEMDGEVQVTTTIRTKGRNVGPVSIRPGTGTNRAVASLNLFKDIKKIQTTLRKDDITWDE